MSTPLILSRLRQPVQPGQPQLQHRRGLPARSAAGEEEAAGRTGHRYPGLTARPQTQAPPKPAQSSEVSPPGGPDHPKSRRRPWKRPSRPRSSGSGSPGKASTPALPTLPPAEIYASLSREDKLSFQLRSLSRHLAQNQPREKSGQGRILALLAQRGSSPSGSWWPWPASAPAP